MKRSFLLLFFIIICFTSLAQKTLELSDFSIKNKKKTTVIYYKNKEISELPRWGLDIFNVFKNYIVIYEKKYDIKDNQYYLMDSNGRLLFDQPFKSYEFASGFKEKFSVFSFPEYAFVVDANLNEIPGTRCTNIERSYYNNEADLSVVWQKYGKKSPFYLYEMEIEQANKSKKYGFIDLATGTIIAKPIYDWLGMYGIVEHGIYLASINGRNEFALYDFNGNRLSEFYDAIDKTEGNFIIKKNKALGLMDYQGKVFIKPAYKDIQGFKDGKHFLCKDDKDKIGIINKNGQILMPFEFSSTNYTILNYPMGNYIPVTKDLKLYGYYGIEEKGLVRNYQYDVAGPEVKNVANVRHTNGDNQIISFNDYSTGALLKNINYSAQLKVLTGYLNEKQKYFQEKYKNAVTNYKTKQEALNYFYPYYREFCTDIMPNANVRIAIFKKEFGSVFTQEEGQAFEEMVKSIQLLKKKMDETIEKAGGRAIYLADK